MNFQSLLPELTLEEKITLLSGSDFSTAAGVERLNIPPLRVADSVSGIRPSQIDIEMTTASFPNTACFGATWDAELLGRLGEQLAQQARLKSAQVILGPTINIHRDPRAGRNFECFSEDPLLSGQLAGAIVNGVRRRGVGSCPKHFVCNDAETLRHYYDVRESVNSRALREIYLAAWQHLLRTADPEGVMTAYNKVDGNFCSENQPLIQGVLREDWGFKGITMSDWFGVHDTVPPIKAGLDLEMPFPVFRASRLVGAVKSGAVTEAEIDARVIKMLELRNRTRACHSQEPERSEITDEANELAREIITGGVVLLKNKNNTLPLRDTQSSRIALIGEYAQDPVVTGGGSASCIPQYRHSPLEIMKQQNLNVKYASGVRTRRIIPVAPVEKLVSGDGKRGVDIKYYNDDSAEPILSETQEKASVWMLGQFKPGLNVPGSRVEISTALTPTTTGEHTLAVRCTGSFSLIVNSKEVLSGPAVKITTEQFIFNHILLESRIRISMNAGETYNVRLVMNGPEKLTAGEPTPYASTLCFEEYQSEDDAIAEAVKLAKESDISVIYAGRSDQYESEGFDLQDIRMPENQTALIKAVAAVSSKTILVMHCGNPIDVSAFIDDTDAVLNAHFPGQEGARGVVDILTGKVSPSGRLATTWFKTIEDVPSFGHFPPEKAEDGSVQIKYAEGLEVGYRRQGHAESVRWPFGFGLSYTTFSYTGMVATVEESRLKCSVHVKNTGSVAGKEVVQLFVAPSNETTVWRPEKELKGFAKVLLQPGESRLVELDVDLEMACSYWDEEKLTWKMDAGTYGVVMGGQEGSFSVKQASVWNHL